MKNIIYRIKWKLLDWLLDDICKRCPGCDECHMGVDSESSPGYYECSAYDVRKQAMKTWGGIK